MGSTSCQYCGCSLTVCDNVWQGRHLRECPYQDSQADPVKLLAWQKGWDAGEDGIEFDEFYLTWLRRQQIDENVAMLGHQMWWDYHFSEDAID